MVLKGNDAFAEYQWMENICYQKMFLSSRAAHLFLISEICNVEPVAWAMQDLLN